MPFQVISREGVKPYPKNLCTLTEMSVPTNKKLQSFVDIWNYLEKILPSTAEIKKASRKQISPKYEWTWNNTYENLYNKTTNIIKKNATMAFFNKREQL